MRRDTNQSYEFPRERLLQNALAEAGGALEVGGHHRLQLLHHAQPPLHFRHDPRLLGQRGKWNAEPATCGWLIDAMTLLRIAIEMSLTINTHRGIRCNEGRRDHASGGLGCFFALENACFQSGDRGQPFRPVHGVCYAIDKHITRPGEFHVLATSGLDNFIRLMSFQTILPTSMLYIRRHATPSSA